MNYAIVLRLLSYILLTEGALLLLPAGGQPVLWRVVRDGRLSVHSGAQRG